jgi:hypothetical protein
VARTDAAGPRSLLESLQRVIERTYDLETGVDDIGRFVIGDEGYRRIYGPHDAAGKVVETVGSATPGAGARTLVREAGGGLAVSIYYPDRLIRCLERNDPTRRLDDGNVDAFATLVEELDHFLMIAERYRSRGVMSLLDLELHANVTKYLVLKMFVGRMRRMARLSAADSAWVRFHIFDKGEFADPDPDVQARYRDASRLASRYVRRLEAIDPARRPSELRRFHRMTPQGKVAYIEANC